MSKNGSVTWPEIQFFGIVRMDILNPIVKVSSNDYSKCVKATMTSSNQQGRKLAIMIRIVLKWTWKILQSKAFNTLVVPFMPDFSLNTCYDVHVQFYWKNKR